jgi:ABC-type sugar transport system ATPase subunit
LRLAEGSGGLVVNGVRVGLPALHPQAGYVGVRPSNVKIFPVSQPDAIPGTVYVTEPMGYDQVIRVEAGDQLLNIKTPLSTGSFKIGQAVWVQPDWRTVHVFDQAGKRLKGEVR